MEGDDETHGYEGPLHVSRGGSSSALAEEFIEGARTLYGWESVVDSEDFKTLNCTSRWAKWIDPRTGKRSDAAHGYVHPILDTQDNLHLLLESKVVRVVFEGMKAVGVEYVKKYVPCSTRLMGSKLFDEEGEDVSPKTIRARMLVVISAGTLSSPLILQRSGIGCESSLTSVGLTNVISDLPAVGENFQDHPLLAEFIRVNTGPDDTSDDLVLGVKETVERAEKEFELGKGPLATNFIDTAIKLRPSKKEVNDIGGEFEKYWNENLECKPDKSAVLSILAAVRPWVG